MNAVAVGLSPIETLFETPQAEDIPLPLELGRLYGRLQFPPHAGRPHVIANFVTSLDGVVSLDVPDHSGGGDISGFDLHDQVVMALLRAVSDAVVVGAGTLRSVPAHLWTAEYIYPPLAAEYRQLRSALGKAGPPLNVIVTASGDIDLGLPVFQSGKVPVLIATTETGARRLGRDGLPASVQLAAVKETGLLTARAIVEAANRARPGDRILVEGGPHLLGDFFSEQALDELFLTLAPQVAGRDTLSYRPGLVAGAVFAPEDPRWATLVSVRRGINHLFLRYSFQAKE